MASGTNKATQLILLLYYVPLAIYYQRHCAEGWVGPRVGPDIFEKREVAFRYKDPNPRPPRP